MLAQGEARARGFEKVSRLRGEEPYNTEAGISSFLVGWRSSEGKDPAQHFTAYRQSHSEWRHKSQRGRIGRLIEAFAAGTVVCAPSASNTVTVSADE